jgi:uncharacterized protein YfeS
MTEKAQRILNELNKSERKVRRYRKRSANPESRDKILGEFNWENLDDVRPMGGDQGMAVLKDMNDLGQQQEQIIRESFPKVTVY